jgi:serine/tyrosine/threonine adenylyltransferase
VRFGSFEYFYYRRDTASLKTLADFVIDGYFAHLQAAPNIGESPENALSMRISKAYNNIQSETKYADWFAEVITRTAHLMAHWQAVGFCHGVMNTDNMSILGLTLDYGPFGFMEAFDAGHICNHSDDQGRYAYNMQPQIGLWNLHALAQSLVPLIEAETLEALLKAYQPQFEDKLDGLLRAKLGLREPHDSDAELIGAMFDAMQANRVDFTLFFRNLSQVRTEASAAHSQPHIPAQDAPVRDLFADREACDAWLTRYRARLALQPEADAARKTRMDAVNPKYVLRNYLAEKAIALARGDLGERDFSEVSRLHTVLQNPFDEQPEHEAYAALPPDWASGIAVSCSS